MNQQPELPIFEQPKCKDYEFLVRILEDKDWLTAREILKAMGLPDTESNRRSIRALAEASEGHIAGGQNGYKLVRAMTAQEYNHYRNWMKSQADRMTARILKSDRVFYTRQKITTGNGILDTQTP